MDFSLPHFDHAGWRRYYDAAFFVTCFEKHLTTEEANAQPFLFYDDAVRKVRVDDYLMIERKFLALLDNLIADQAVLCNRANRDSQVLTFHVKRFKGFRPYLRRKVISALREKFSEAGDLYIPHLGMRIDFGHDMTHRVYLRDAAAEPDVRRFVREAGLHVIETRCDGLGDPSPLAWARTFIPQHKPQPLPLIVELSAPQS